ncbi:hypothetical protein D3C71_1516870 [compost metagenome]
MRDMLEFDAHRDALRQPHPTEAGFHAWQALCVGLLVAVGNASPDAGHPPRQHLVVPHQADPRRRAGLDAAQFGFLEVAGDPEAVGVDQGDVGLARHGVVALVQSQARDVAIGWRTQFSACKIQLRPVHGDLCTA